MKNLKKKLGAVIFCSVLSLGLAGCNPNPEYHFDGKIGEEQVKFYEKDWYNDNILEVTRADGTKIKYFDNRDDFRLDWVEITKDGETKRYYNNVIGKEVLEEAQKQFDSYLKKILEIKRTEGLDNIKK